MSIMAIIPARSGSKGIPHKNIRFLAGHPLIAWSIAAAKLSQRIDEVLVSTDSDEYAAIAKNYGAMVPFLRPVEIARDDSTDLDFVLHAITYLRNLNGNVPSYLVHLRPTSPNRDPALIDKAIGTMLADTSATSLCSAHAVPHPPCKYFKRNGDGTFSGYMGEDYVNIPRQACEPAFRPNGHVDVLKTSNIIVTATLHGPRRLAFLAPDPGDIDTEDDFLALDAILLSVDNGLATYLRRC